MNPYEKLMARKRKWTPVQTTAGTVTEGAEETILRALALRHMELPVGEFIKDALANDVPLWRGHYWNPTSKMKRTTTWLLVTLPMLTVLMKRRSKRRSGSEMLGRRILITRSRKQWLPSVQFSSFYFRSFALMVTLECVR